MPQSVDFEASAAGEKIHRRCIALQGLQPRQNILMLAD